MLTWNVIYNYIPNYSDNWVWNYPKYTCYDNKVHIRLRDFNSNQVIKGFEAKLTYLLAYILHFNLLSDKEYKTKNIIRILQDLSETEEVEKIKLCIRKFTNDSNFKGLKISKNYNKGNLIDLGEVDNNCFPVSSSDNSIENFLSKLHINTLSEYLFNDSYKIVIKEEKQLKDNKFTRKQLKKLKNKNLDFEKLW